MINLDDDYRINAKTDAFCTLDVLPSDTKTYIIKTEARDQRPVE